jgi:hypothetical protein
MAAKRGKYRGGARLLRKTWAKEACGCPVSVSAEQRRHLIECCAFFRAERFRDAGPGQYRRQDLREAAADIDSILDAHGGRRRTRRSRIEAPDRAGK